jgi:DNA-binding MarR family transcriptional regulator
MSDAAATRLRSTLQALYAVGSDLNINMAISFLTVAAFPGRTLKEYEQLLGHPSSTMSRHLLDLGPRNRNKQPGLGLVDVDRNPEDWRYNVYTLTPKGRALVATLTQLMEKP